MNLCVIPRAPLGEVIATAELLAMRQKLRMETQLLFLQYLYFYNIQNLLEKGEVGQNPSFAGSLDPVPLSDPFWSLILSLV